jgi:hypothetical protein
MNCGAKPYAEMGENQINIATMNYGAKPNEKRGGGQIK